MPYNLTNLTSDPSVSSFLLTANNYAGGILFGILSVALFFILLMTLKKWEFASALLVSGWVCFVLSSILWWGGFLNIIYPLGYLAIAGFTLLYKVTVD